MKRPVVTLVAWSVSWRLGNRKPSTYSCDSDTYSMGLQVQERNNSRLAKRRKKIYPFKNGVQTFTPHKRIYALLQWNLRVNAEVPWLTQNRWSAFADLGSRPWYLDTVWSLPWRPYRTSRVVLYAKSKHILYPTSNWHGVNNNGEGVCSHTSSSAASRMLEQFGCRRFRYTGSMRIGILSTCSSGWMN